MKTVDGKVPMELLVPEALEAWAWAMKEGADKYKPNDWRHGNGMPWTWLIAAIQRHANAMMKGENFDPGSKNNCTHAGMIMASASMLVYYLEHHQQFNKDDRFKIGAKPIVPSMPQCDKCDGKNIVHLVDRGGHMFDCRVCDRAANHPTNEQDAVNLWNEMDER